MHKFTCFLGAIAAVFAVLALCTVYLTQTTFVISCAVVPIMLALAFRHFQNWEHGWVSLVTIGSAVVIGSSLLAYGSYCQTFNNGAKGFLVGDGWNSVAASAVVGVFVGLFCGIIATLAYFVLSAAVGRSLSR